ncbi:unnamed protein product, partial [Ectocarpus sp. 8 AP-2014]
MLGSRLAFASAAVKWSHLPVSTPPPSSRRLLTMRAGPDVLCLDCTGTIMRIKGSMPRLYLGVLEDRLGVSEGGLPDKVCEQDLLHSFRASLKRRSKELPCFGTGVMSSEDWWAEVVMATFRGAGVSDETLGISQEGGRDGAAAAAAAALEAVVYLMTSSIGCFTMCSPARPRGSLCRERKRCWRIFALGLGKMEDHGHLARCPTLTSASTRSLKISACMTPSTSCSHR